MRGCVEIASTPKWAPVVRSVNPDVKVLSPCPRGHEKEYASGGRLGGNNDGSSRCWVGDGVKT